IRLVMARRAGRKAGRADIADHLPATDALAGTHRDAAHMAVAGAETLAMVEFHIIAETAVAAGDRHDAVGHGIDGRAIAAAEIDAAVHALVAEDRVAPHAEGRGDAAARRPHHTAALFADARRLEPLGAAVGSPFEHRKLGLSAADQPGIEQLARLALARLGAAIVDDDVELVAAAHLAPD